MAGMSKSNVRNSCVIYCNIIEVWVCVGYQNSGLQYMHLTAVYFGKMVDFLHYNQTGKLLQIITCKEIDHPTLLECGTEM